MKLREEEETGGGWFITVVLSSSDIHLTNIVSTWYVPDLLPGAWGYMYDQGRPNRRLASWSFQTTTGGQTLSDDHKQIPANVASVIRCKGDALCDGGWGVVKAQKALFLGFPVAQGLRIRLPIQVTRVRALGWEDPTCCRATKPVRHNY